MHDVDLLNSHRAGNESAFAEIVRRHVGWIHAIARRRLGDGHLAEDVSQSVFVLLHRKSPTFLSDRALTTWLHRAAWYATEVARRAQRRRIAHEAKAMLSRAEGAAVADEWKELAPLLDELVAKLSKGDREAIVLRYYRGITHAALGEELNVGEEAARKRVTRAVERLRELAKQRGLPIATPAMCGLLGDLGRLAPPPPSGLIASTTCAAVASHTSAFTNGTIASLTKGTWLMMRMKTISLVATCVAFYLVSIATTWVTATHVAAAQAAAPTTLPAASTRKDEDEARRSPWPAIRWRDITTPEVMVDGVWYQLDAIDGIPADFIVKYAQDREKKLWDKRFEEDLVPLLAEIGTRPGATVRLDLTRLDDKHEHVVMEHVPMTNAKRQAVYQARKDRGAP